MLTRAKVFALLREVFVASSQLVSALTGGYSDETLSARAHRRANAGHSGWARFERLVDTLFTWEGPGHCARAALFHLSRRANPPDQRD